MIADLSHISLNPMNFVSNKQQLQKYECMICMQTSINMLRCKTCKKSFCYQCSVDQWDKFNKCPQKCTNGKFQVQLIPQRNIHYKCPFSQQCKNVLKTKRQFYQHSRNCKLISQNQLQQQNKKWGFKCFYNHSLQINTQPFSIIGKRKLCSGCGMQTTLRARCLKCDLDYCNICRPLPIFNDKCPKQHIFIQKQAYSSNYRCDVCEICPKMLKPYIYEDFICNFGLCIYCYEEYPRFLHPIKYIQYERNYCNYFSEQKITTNSQQQIQLMKQKHKLQILQQKVQKICDHCKKSKICYKKCLKCESYYCYSCKPFEVLQNLQCQFGHQFKIHNFHQENNYGQNKSQMKNCSSCVKKIEQITNYKLHITDNKCKVTLCNHCAELQLKRNKNDSRKISVANKAMCPKNHYLYILLNNQNRFQKCQKCQQNRICKFYCNGCSPQGYSQYYCPHCIKPIKNKKCYCGKPLQLLHTKQGICMQCDKKGQQNYGCLSCNYFICQKCYQGQVKQQQIAQIQIMQQIK